MKPKHIKLFLRITIAIAFLSAVADRFGMWPKDISVWGNWQNFLDYTALINPWFPQVIISAVGAVATAVEVILAVCLLIGFKTELMAKVSGVLLLLFAFSMTFSIGIKAPLDYSVFTAAAAAFALSAFKEKYLEVDSLLSRKL